MRIGIDARMLGKGFGIARYVEQLTKQLGKIDSEHEWVIFLRKEMFEKWKAPNSNWKKVCADIHWYTLEEQTQLSKIIEKENVDLMHFPHFNVPLLYKGKFVVTIHDLTMYHFPRPDATTKGPLVYWFKDKIHRKVVKNAAQKAKTIFATTEFTKQDIIKYLKVNGEKIVVTYQAPFDKPEIVEEFKNDKPYFMYVGAAYPHKNLDGLLEAWKLFEEKNGNEYDLILAGKETSFYERLINSEKFRECKNVRYLGMVPDEKLASLYQGATAFLFASLYEGFGIPPLEAMQFGTPVISSNRSCMPEVLGAAALYVDPKNSEQFADAISALAESREIRGELIMAGKEQLKRFSWEKLARETLLEYDKLA